ncbi:unnamed protein product, partial [Polarella glacialis]
MSANEAVSAVPAASPAARTDEAPCDNGDSSAPLKRRRVQPGVFLAAAALDAVAPLRERLDKTQLRWNAVTAETAGSELPAVIAELSEVLSAVHEALEARKEERCSRLCGAEEEEPPSRREAQSAREALRCLAHIARDRLMLLLLQGGQPGKAQELLLKSGYLYRLSDAVLTKTTTTETTTTTTKTTIPTTTQLAPTALGSSTGGHGSGEGSLGSSERFVGFVDDALPLPLLRDLQAAFGLESPYWPEHGYWSDDAFFSYEVPLAEASSEANGPGPGPARHPAVEAALHIAEIAASVAPQLAGPGRRPGYAEWWCHSKPNCAGHLLHFDQSSDAQVPSISTVLYLSSADIGGSTLMTEQTISEEKAMGRRGWLCHPKENRLLLFDGQLLHGVVAGGASGAAQTTAGQTTSQTTSKTTSQTTAGQTTSQTTSQTSQRRVTLMVALCPKRPGLDFRSGTQMPSGESAGLKWARATASTGPSSE